MKMFRYEGTHAKTEVTILWNGKQKGFQIFLWWSQKCVKNGGEITNLSGKKPKQSCLVGKNGFYEPIALLCHYNKWKAITAAATAGCLKTLCYLNPSVGQLHYWLIYYDNKYIHK